MTTQSGNIKKPFHSSLTFAAFALSALLASSTFSATQEPMELGASFTIVGKSIYLPEQNLSKPIAEGRGIQLFVDLQDCVKEDPLAGDSEGYVHIWTSTNEFYNYLLSDTQLDAAQNGAYSMKATLSGIYEGSTEIKKELAGAVYDYQVFKETITLDKDCEKGKTLSSDLLDAFNALPYPVPSPDLDTSWRPYQKFLEFYGSHYVSQIQTGARFRSYTFKTTTKKATASELKIAACVEVHSDPGKNTGTSIKGCENIDETQRKKINTSEYISKVRAVGGNEKIRNRLNTGETATPDLLVQFAETGDVPQDGVRYQLKPIWHLLNLRAEDTDLKQQNQALSLQAYFEGFLASNCSQKYGCGCKKVEDPKGNVTLRRFVQINQKSAKYACQVPAMGCRNSDDCHFNFGKQYCQCYGDHCVNVAKRDGNVLSMSVNYSNKITGINTGPNKSCRLGSECSCIRPEKNAMWHTNWSN